MENEHDGSSSSSSSIDIFKRINPNQASSLTMSQALQRRKAGRKKFKETRHPVYRGIRERKGGKWVCEVREPNKKSRIWLGTFPSPEMAARAYDIAALALRGEKAALNFSDSTWRLKQAKSSSASDIQIAALEAATMFRPPDHTSFSPHSFSIEFHGTTSFGDDVDSKHGSVDSASTGMMMQNEDSHRKNVETGDMYLDEEVFFNMPNFYISMAEGLVITPPSMEPVGDCDMDFTLWGRLKSVQDHMDNRFYGYTWQYRIDLHRLCFLFLPKFVGKNESMGSYNGFILVTRK